MEAAGPSHHQPRAVTAPLPGHTTGSQRSGSFRYVYDEPSTPKVTSPIVELTLWRFEDRRDRRLAHFSAPVAVGPLSGSPDLQPLTAAGAHEEALGARLPIAARVRR